MLIHGGTSTRSTTLGRLLSEYRTAASLSQKTLAKRAGPSERGISDLERGARRTPRAATVRRLAQALNLAEPERAAFVAATATAASHASSFIGRKHEVTEVIRLLASARLLTLTGPGNTGKTRGAIEVGSAVVDGYPDGVFFVSLAPISDPRLVTSTIARVMAVTEESRPAIDARANFLRPRHVRLILDSFEQEFSVPPVDGRRVHPTLS